LMGRQRIADTLARAGLHLSASTARRMVKKNTLKPTPDDGKTPQRSGAVNDNTSSQSSQDIESGSAKPKRVVTATRPDHVWHTDLTAIPTLLGFWVPWFPYSWAQRWPFCFWVLAVIDHYSRKAMMLRCFRVIPTAAQVTDALDVAIAIGGRAPKYIISDQGAQFREDYKDWCEICGIRPRFGAIGQHGSIAICERFIRTIKQECARRIVIPLATKAFEQELLMYALWYNEHRPHQSLLGRTPNEVYEERFAARDKPPLEVRRMPKSENPGTACVEPIIEIAPRLRLVVKHFEGRKHLPIVELERAA
jgi:transposase InsO family protein